MRGGSRCPMGASFPVRRPETAGPPNRLRAVDAAAGSRSRRFDGRAERLDIVMTKRTRLAPAALAAVLLCTCALSAQERSLTEEDNKSVKYGPAPRTAQGKPDLSGYWKGTRDTKPGGNIGK